MGDLGAHHGLLRLQARRNEPSTKALSSAGRVGSRDRKGRRKWGPFPPLLEAVVTVPSPGQ